MIEMKKVIKILNKNIPIIWKFDFIKSTENFFNLTR